jgi:hypothetical protein
MAQWPHRPTEPPSPNPRANLRLARGPGTTSQGLSPPSRVWRPLNKPPPRSRVPAPQVSPRLARGFQTLKQISASLEVSLSPRCLPTPPTEALNALTCRGRPGQFESPPRRSPDTARESDVSVVQTTHRCTAIPGTVQVLCGMAGVIFWHCATRSHPSSTPHPSKKDSNALEECTTTNPVPVQDDDEDQERPSGRWMTAPQ